MGKAAVKPKMHPKWQVIHEMLEKAGVQGPYKIKFKDPGDYRSEWRMVDLYNSPLQTSYTITYGEYEYSIYFTIQQLHGCCGVALASVIESHPKEYCAVALQICKYIAEQDGFSVMLYTDEDAGQINNARRILGKTWKDSLKETFINQRTKHKVHIWTCELNPVNEDYDDDEDDYYEEGSSPDD